MNFLIDANLPRRLVNIFSKRGHRAVHTLDLPGGNATDDLAILQYSDDQIVSLPRKMQISCHPSG